MEGVDLKMLLTQVPSKLDLKAMFSKMEKSFGAKLQTLHEEKQFCKRPGKIRDIAYGDDKVIFQDLAQSTLIARRALHPITTALSETNIRFRWSFPFALVVFQQGKTHSISTPADVSAFQQALGLPMDTVEDWTGYPKGLNGNAPQEKEDVPHRAMNSQRHLKAQ
ncbi:Hypothetical predicted protein [Pelobates cultripes]|uniref:Uncharacterized protein n=1 Tax=Pelobates cultripes TaxID=61616 RepID=A0AAD1VI48_PELCU|nr:Hypothetical predicted protein [Pelobates cultripes]